MKKLMTVFLAAALVFAVAGQASATALETSGELRVRSWYLDGYVTQKNHIDYWDQRLRLNMDWAVADGVKIHARADIYEGQWGSNNAATSTGGLSNVNTQQISFDQVNMTFAWPGTPLTFVLGRQDVSWGTGVDVEQDNRDRAKVYAKFGDWVAGVSYDKNVETFADQGNKKDDNRAWTAYVTGPVGDFKIGILGAAYDDGTKTAPNTVDRKFLKGNAWVMGKIAMVEVKAEASYLSGDSGKQQANGSSQDLTGFGAYAGAFVPVGPVKLGFEGIYVQGDDPETADKDEGGAYSDYQGPFWSVIFYQNMDYPGLGLDSNTSSYDKDRQVANAVAGKFSAVYAAPIKGLTIIGNALYASADKVADGVDKAMGTELDLIAVYGITDNVSVTAGVGYAILGDYWKGKLGAAAGDVPDNPIGTVVAFNVKF